MSVYNSKQFRVVRVMLLLNRPINFIIAKDRQSTPNQSLHCLLTEHLGFLVMVHHLLEKKNQQNVAGRQRQSPRRARHQRVARSQKVARAVVGESTPRPTPHRYWWRILSIFGLFSLQNLTVYLDARFRSKGSHIY